MAGRQNKVGLDYFELDCHMDEKVRLIQAEFGMKGFGIVVRLLQEIYGEKGYYIEWTQDRELLFASENGSTSGSVNEIVMACIRRNIFSERLFNEFGILSSGGIQKQYLKATSKREVVDLKKEYLLISIPENSKNVVVNSISSDINSISSVINTQSRVEKSREENIYIVEKLDSVKQIVDYLNSVCGTKYKHNTKNTKKHINARLSEGYSIDDFKTVIDKKNKEWHGTQMEKFLRPDTLFGTKFESYLNQNIVTDKPKNSFNTFHQRDYDFDELERQLLTGGTH